MARAQRRNGSLLLAFVDVDHLKAVNDSRGHVAGDRLLLDVVNTIRGPLRSYDLVIRYGGDEFVCVVSGLDTAAVAARLALVNPALAHRNEHGSVSIGIAELQPDDVCEDLIARADAALYEQRGLGRAAGKDHRSFL